MDQVLASIYNNIDGYRKAIIGLVGNKSYLFIDDIISECILKVHSDITEGRKTIQEITYKNTGDINHSYFNRLVVTRTINMLKAKKSRHLPEEHIPPSPEQEQTPTLDYYDQEQYIAERLDQYAKNDTHTHHHAMVFRYLFFDGLSIRKLSQETGIPRYSITNSKKHMLNQVQHWIQEGINTDTIMAAKPVVGINEEGDRVVFASLTQAAKSGFNKVDRSIARAKPNKGYTFEYVQEVPGETVKQIADQEPTKGMAPITDPDKQFTESDIHEVEPEIKAAVEEHLAVSQPSSGLGDTVAKVLHSKPIEPVTKVLKKLIWGDKGDCGCNDRINALNKLISYNRYRPHRYLTKEEDEGLNALKNKARLNSLQVGFLVRTHSSIFQHTKPNICAGCGGSGALVSEYRDELVKLQEGMKKLIQEDNATTEN